MKKCNICNSGEKEFLFNKFGFDIVKCKSCKFVYVDREFDIIELEKYYSKDYYSGANEYVYKDYKAERTAKSRTFLRKLRDIESLKKFGKLLDIGCAMGFFLDVARQKGWETYGIELSKYSANVAKNELGLNVLNCELIQANFPDNYFDVVTMWDVIEHLPDPALNLKEIYRILKKDGLLVITTGDIDNINARVFKRRWILIAPPWHLYYFSRNTLKAILKNIGFSIKQISNSGIPLCNRNVPRFPRLFRIVFNKYTLFILGLSGIGDAITVYAEKH